MIAMNFLEYLIVHLHFSFTRTLDRLGLIAQCTRFNSFLRRKGRNRRSREGLSMLGNFVLFSSSYIEEIGTA